MSNATGYRCRILADSTSPAGVRLTTLELRYPLMVHAELLTHRCLSRNSRSSRATPPETLIREVETDPAMPARWTANGKGMVASKDLDSQAQSYAVDGWRNAVKLAVLQARYLAELGCHKQIVNRILAPFAYIWTVTTATGEGWDSFLNLRVADDVDPTLLPLAVRIGRTLRDSIPEPLRPSHWHLPYLTEREINQHNIPDAACISAARCARVSYRPFDQAHVDVDADLALSKRLAESRHWSPFEHQAMATGNIDISSRNFHAGWVQHRALVDPIKRTPFDFARLDAYPTDGHFADAVKGGAA